MVQMDVMEVFVDDQVLWLFVNILLVLDCLGLMEDKGKIEYFKSVVKFVVDCLIVKDYLFIVEYDDQIMFMWFLLFVEVVVFIYCFID